MRLNPRLALVAAVSIAALALAPASAIARDDDDHGDHQESSLLRSGLVGSTTPKAGGATVFDVVPGGAPWVTDDDSKVRVRRDGRIDVRVEGLVIPPPEGTGVNPVTTATATLYCNAKAADATELFALDGAGNGEVHDMLTLPDKCVAPVVLINPRGAVGTYIAASG